MNIAYINNNLRLTNHEQFACTLAEHTSRQLVVFEQLPNNLQLAIENQQIDIVIISCFNSKRPIQKSLKACRELRIPYIILTDTMQSIDPISHILATVTMLEEEVYKAEILGHLTRFTKATITLFQANDYGSRAETNTNKISTALVNTFNTTPQIIKAQKDSFSLAREAAERMTELHANILVLTSSRDYGLDDILFGPQELHAIKHSPVPVLLLNPRDDLFSLCD